MTQPWPTWDTAQRHSYQPQIGEEALLGTPVNSRNPPPPLFPCGLHFLVYKLLYLFLTTVTEGKTFILGMRTWR